MAEWNHSSNIWSKAKIHATQTTTLVHRDLTREVIVGDERTFHLNSLKQCGSLLEGDGCLGLHKPLNMMCQ